MDLVVDYCIDLYDTVEDNNVSCAGHGLGRSIPCVQ